MSDVRHCILCGSTELERTGDALLVSVTCNHCHATFVVEYDSESPGLKRRIEITSRRKGPIRPEQ